MNKVLVSLEVPSISKAFDVYIPDFLTVGEVVPLVSEAIEEMSDHKYVSSGHELLCIKESSLLLKKEQTLGDYGVKNGDHLILF